MSQNILIISTSLASILIFILGLFVYIKGVHSGANKAFIAFTASVFTWLFFYSIAYLINDQFLSFYFFKIGYIGIIFIPTTWYCFEYKLLNKNNKILASLVYVGYILAIFFVVLLIFTKLFIAGLHDYAWGFYPQVHTSIHIGFLAYFNIYFTIAIILIFSSLRNISLPVFEKNKIKYVLIACIVGTFAAIDFLPNYQINYKLNIIPVGFIFMISFCVITAYAIIKHNLLDIRIAVTRVGIFIFVYSLVLGLPFWLGYTTKSWFITGITMLLLASSGPFIYNRLRQGAEQILLKDQIRYQKALVRLSQNMHQIKDLNKLLRLILIQVTRHLHLTESAIYLFNKQENAFECKSAFTGGQLSFKKRISANCNLINYLKTKNSPFLTEELNSKDNNDITDKPLASGMLVPCTARNELVSFIALGPKPKGLIYNDLDISAFRLLSLHAGLAIENCQFWQDEKARLAREEQIRRYNTMDNFSASLAHEIDNPVTCVIGDLFCAMEFFKQYVDQIPDPLKQEAAAAYQKNKDAFENMQRITKLTRAVREFSKENKGELSVISVNEMLDEFLPLVEAQCKHSGIDFTKDIEPTINIEGNKVDLADALLNLATNAIHAIIYGNETTGLDDETQIEIHEKRIELKVYRKENTCIIAMKDTGCGISKKLKDDIFLDFVTTKASSVGTGMGLSRVRKIADMHKGRIWYESEGRGKGTTFFIEIPLTDKPLPEKTKKRGK